MTWIVITMQVYINGEAVPVYDIKLGIRRSMSSASSSRNILPLSKEPPALINVSLDGHQIYNGDSISLRGDQQVKLNTLI